MNEWVGDVNERLLSKTINERRQRTNAIFFRLIAALLKYNNSLTHFAYPLFPMVAGVDNKNGSRGGTVPLISTGASPI